MHFIILTTSYLVTSNITITVFYKQIISLADKVVPLKLKSANITFSFIALNQIKPISN